MSPDTNQNDRSNLKDIVLDEDKRIDKEIPGSAFGMVALSYFVALALVLGGVAALYYLL